MRGEVVESIHRVHVAVAHAENAHAGLAILDGIGADRRLERYGPLAAARADLLRRAGDAEGADAAYVRAIELSANAAERAALERERQETVADMGERNR